MILSKKFARVSGVKSINNDDFKELVTLPRKEPPIKEALEKKDVVEILNACKDIKLKTALLRLASTGGRSAEVFSLRIHKDQTSSHQTLDKRGSSDAKIMAQDKVPSASYNNN